ncbi:MAG TPA: 30S ribosome-binding factor RbfA [Candidatus Portnoybacteria bacterium]|nr:30S ribosome-binding factor RbfA [Candidatus Portnoybacteria bacterium]MDD5752406.1 30S ribosome-binding factor RbfA [Candidatus Portnoybacteria bacterium]HNU96742.1 30S ribosome-binding factor RbfA [Candidatus Portnoybacteria bacterium]HOZ16524.1 30S ribosome-binding factor RbfA [Candidatus Portnoybacteria bacterium]HPH52283.1 30S ribosome-binding factor RbfA [Candidatus Portnoybacteria bacterium]
MKDRISRVNSLMQEKIAEILQREIFIKDVFITVQNVDVSKDLNYAKIKISVFPFKESKKVLEILKKQSSNLQRILNEKVTIKFVPRIRFVLDRIEEKAVRVEEILRNLKG